MRHRLSAHVVARPLPLSAWLWVIQQVWQRGRSGRGGSDAVDARVRRVCALIAALWVLSGADLLFTLWAHLFTPFHEMNPIARSMLVSGQYTTLVLFKLVATGVAHAIFWRLRGRARSEAALWLMVGVFVALAMRWSMYTHGAIAATDLPDSLTAPSITTSAVSTPALSTPALSTPAVSGPALSSPAILDTQSSAPAFARPASAALRVGSAHVTPGVEDDASLLAAR